MTILATLFDALRRFRKQVGRVRLYFIQNFLSDGRLIRIVGQDGAQAIQLTKERATGEYDVIVDDAPTSPNQKEANWAIISQIAPAFKEQLAANPALIPQILEYSPLPSALVEKLKAALDNPAGQRPDPEMVKLQQQMELAKAKAQSDAELAKAKLQADLAAKQAEAELERQKMLIEAELARQKMAAEIALAREKAAAELELEHQKAQHKLAIEQDAAQRKHEADLMRVKQESETRTAVRQHESNSMRDIMAGLSQAMTAPKRVVRNGSGQVVGVETVSG